jgi:hypothetical protein
MPRSGLRHRLSNVDEEWRVSLVNFIQPAGGKPVSAVTVRDLLRGRAGAGVPVTGGKPGIFMYAATGEAAAAAEGIAREVLAEQGLAADIRVERWDQSRRAWLPPGDTPAELPSEQERRHGRKYLNAAGTVIAAILDGISNADF